MTILEVKNHINSLLSHITFIYNNKDCGVDPLALDKFEMWYGDELITVKTIDEVINKKFFNGKSLNEIIDVIEIDF